MTQFYKISAQHLKERLNSINIARLIDDVLGFKIDTARIGEIKSKKILDLFTPTDSLEEKFYKLIAFKINSVNANDIKNNILPLVLGGVKHKDTFSTIAANSLISFYENLGQDLSEKLSEEERQILKLDKCASLVAWWVDSITDNQELLIKAKTVLKPLYFQSEDNIKVLEKNASTKPIIAFFEEIDSDNEQLLTLETLNNVKSKAVEILNWQKSKTTDFDWGVEPSYLETSWSDLDYALQKCNISITNVINVDPKLLVPDANFLKFAHHFFQYFQVFNHKDSHSFAWNISGNAFQAFGNQESVDKAINLFLCDSRIIQAIKDSPNINIQVLAGLWQSCKNPNYNSSKIVYSGTSAQIILSSIFREVLADTSIIERCESNAVIFLSQLLSEDNLNQKHWQDFILNVNFPGKKIKEPKSVITSYWAMYTKNQSNELFIKILRTLSEPDLDCIGWEGIHSI